MQDLLYHHNNTGDQLESYYGFSHWTVKWWRRLFFHQIDMAIVNAYILYLMSPCSSKRLTHSQFRVELAKQLLMEEVIPVEEPEGRPLGPHLDPNPPSSCLTGRHFPGKLGSTTAGHQRQQQCVVCSHKKGRGRTTTTYKCKQCQLPMCVVPCFELYHTRTHPERYLWCTPPLFLTLSPPNSLSSTGFFQSHHNNKRFTFPPSFSYYSLTRSTAYVHVYTVHTTWSTNM